MKWTLGLKGFRRARSEHSQELSTPATPPRSPPSTIPSSTTRLRKSRPAPLPLDSSAKCHLEVRLESRVRMTASEEMSLSGSEMGGKRSQLHLDEGYGSGMEMEPRRTRGKKEQLGDGFGVPVEVVSFASPFEQEGEQQHILSRSFSTRLPIRRPSSSTSPSESDRSSKFSLSTPPSSRASSPAITRSSTINTISSSFHARRSSSSTRSHLSYSPPSTPTSSLLSLPKLTTRLGEDGRRVLSSRRRGSVGPELERVRRTKKSFGVGDDGDSSASASAEEREGLGGRAGLARVRTSMPPLSAAYYEADDESMELLTPTETSPLSRRNTAPAFRHSRRRSCTSSPLSPLSPQLSPIHSPSPTSPITPRSIVIIPLASIRRHSTVPSSATSLAFTPLQHSFPINNIEESPSATPRPSSLRRPSAIAFADSPSARLLRAPIPSKAKRRETMSVEPGFAVGKCVYGTSSEGRKSLEELDQSVWEERREWWEIGDERERGRGCLKVVNPDEGAGSTSTSRRPSLETPITNRSSYYSCSSEFDPLPIGLSV